MASDIRKAVLAGAWLALAAPVFAADSDGVASQSSSAQVDGPREVQTASGLRYRVLQIGAGERPAPEDEVVIHYAGKVLDGEEFGNSRKAGRPVQFAIRQVIAGWSEALQLMPEGSRYEFIVPPELAFGDKGVNGLIGPQATLVLDLELLSINSDDSQVAKVTEVGD